MSVLEDVLWVSYIVLLWGILIFESTRNETKLVLNEIVYSSSKVEI